MASAEQPSRSFGLYEKLQSLSQVRWLGTLLRCTEGDQGGDCVSSNGHHNGSPPTGDPSESDVDMAKRLRAIAEEAVDAARQRQAARDQLARSIYPIIPIGAQVPFPAAMFSPDPRLFEPFDSPEREAAENDPNRISPLDPRYSKMLSLLESLDRGSGFNEPE